MTNHSWVPSRHRPHWLGEIRRRWKLNPLSSLAYLLLHSYARGDAAVDRSGQCSRDHLAHLVDFEQEAVMPRSRINDMHCGTAWKVTRQVLLLGQRVQAV